MPSRNARAMLALSEQNWKISEAIERIGMVFQRISISDKTSHRASPFASSTMEAYETLCIAATKFSRESQRDSAELWGLPQVDDLEVDDLTARRMDLEVRRRLELLALETESFLEKEDGPC